MSRAIFLTRGEISIRNASDLSIHLKPNDKRWKDITALMAEGRLKIVTINPKLEKYHRLYKNCWYFIQTVEYIRSYDCDHGYIHFDFNYISDSKYVSYPSDKNAASKYIPGVRIMKPEEVKKFRKTLFVEFVDITY